VGPACGDRVRERRSEHRRPDPPDDGRGARRPVLVCTSRVRSQLSGEDRRRRRESAVDAGTTRE
jgi:hypothetical protein